MTYKIGLLEMFFRGNFQAQRNHEVKFLPRKIYRCIKNFPDKLHVPKVIELTPAKKELILLLPYPGQQSFEVQNRIQCCLKKKAPVFNLKVVFQSKKTTFHARYSQRIKCCTLT